MFFSTIKEEDIFFGVIHQDGNRGGLVKRQPTLLELHELWQERPDLFKGTTCECGHLNYIYRHIIKPLKDDPGMVGASFIETICPNCGKREMFGANYFRAKLRVDALNEIIGK